MEFDTWIQSIAVGENSNSSNSSSTTVSGCGSSTTPRIQHPEIFFRWSMPAASEAIPIRIPIGAHRDEDGFVPCGVTDNDTSESVEDPPYFLDMSHYSQSVEDGDGPSAATMFTERVSFYTLHFSFGVKQFNSNGRLITMFFRSMK